ncbi:MAG TPA: hypothetical protein P5075_05640 [Eubacteriales bacterium]|nr:hypothetical protein [Eubacteriales bacterium]
MKKFILTVALVLAVVTSLVAGTMAAYTQQLDTTSEAITTKTFSIKGNMSDNFTKAIEIAPGESVEYKLEIKNDGEVNAKLNMKAAIVAAAGDEINGLKLEVVSVEKITAGEVVDGKSVNFTTGDGKNDMLRVGETAKVTLRVTWVYANDDTTNAQDNADMDKASSQLSVTVNATGLASSTTYAIGDVDTEFGN